MAKTRTATRLTTAARPSASSKPKTEKPVYQIRVTLRHTQPPIWRQLLVPSDMRLDQLHGVLQIAMGWTNSHLHQFIIDGQYYSLPAFELDQYDDVEVRDESRVRLHQVLATSGRHMVYEYDFGDNWQHDIILEQVLPRDPDSDYPRCIGGERAGPPEDCGGVWGYSDLLETIRDPDHEDYQAMRDWLGGDFDPEEFDLEKINQRLKSKRLK